MRRALELAALGLGRTSPNPAVGAVVVRDDTVVGEGYHERAGGRVGGGLPVYFVLDVGASNA